MIDHLDNLLRAVLLRDVDDLTSESQVRFQPPDDEWRTVVANLQVDGTPAHAVNAYLVDVRTNVHMRSELRVRSVHNGDMVEERGAAKIDCHYLISAWSPARAGEQVEPALDEHALLYEVLAALQNAAPINASRIYPAGSAVLAAVPPIIRDADLLTWVAPQDGFGKLAEFWGAMGADHRWRPALELVVTLPVAFGRTVVGPLVTTQVLKFRQPGEPGATETWTRIGGVVHDGTSPVVGSWVGLETLDAVRVDTAISGEAGRFVFDGVLAGRYRLRARAIGRPEALAEIEVPSPVGRYEVVFAP